MSRLLSPSLEASEALTSDSQEPAGNVSGPMTTTNTQTKSITTISQTRQDQTVISKKSTQMTFQTQLCSVEDSPVNLLVWLENVKDSRTSVERAFLRLPESQKLKDPRFYSLKMLTESATTTTETRLKPSSERWGTWGIGTSTKCLTADISQFHRIGKECSLLDILEQNVPRKYFLSQKAKQFLMRRMEENKKMGRGFGAVFLPLLEQPITKDTKQEDRLSAQQLTQDMALLETQENPT